jgi:hypothetical protein
MFPPGPANSTALTPVQRAERHARLRGYRGVWPPPPRPRIDTPEELKAVLDRLDRGELTANLVAAAGDHLMQFFRAIPPELFMRLAQRLLKIVLYEELGDPPVRAEDIPAPRVRVRAVQACVRPMLRVLEMVPKLQRLQGDPSPALAQLLQSLHAFFAPFGKGRMGEVAAKLMSMATSATNPETAVRAAAAAAELTVAAMSTLVNAKLGLERAAQAPDPAALAAAHASFKEIECRAAAELARRGAKGDTDGSVAG